MGSSLSSSDQALSLRVGEVLHYLWDPVGIAGLPAARDEYDAWVPEIVSLLKAGADAAQVAGCLSAIVTGRLALAEDHDLALHVAEILLDWRQALAQPAAP